MSLDKKLFKAPAAEAGNGGADAEQGLILHLDANDVDSYDGIDGSIWYDISEHDVTIPLSDNADDLELHLNASDSTSYGGSGTTWTDVSGNSRNATITSAVSATYDKDNGGYFEFTAASVGVTVPHDTAFNSSTNITLECWVKRDDTTEDTIINKGDDGTNSWFLMYNPSNGYYYYNYATGGGVKSGTSGLSTGQWEHVVVTTDASGSKKIYVNGENKTTIIGGSGTTSISDTGVLNIGGRNLYLLTGNAGLNGYIGQVRFYSKVLSASDVGQNYRHGRDYIYTDLYDSDPSDLALHFDAADLTNAANTTWTDKVASLALTKSGTVNYDDELGDFVDFGGGYYGNDTATTTIKNSSGDFTIEFWYNFDVFGGTNALLGIMQDSSLRGLLMYFDGSGMDVYNYKNGTMGASQFTSQSFSTLGISTGNWYHIVHIIDASASIKTYVDGVLKATSTSNAGGTHWTAMDGIRIGDMETLSYTLDGKMGQFRIYKEILSDEQVMQNYLFTKNNYPNSNHGTITGATWNSYYFDFERSSSNNVTISDSSSLDISGDITLSAWINEESVDNYGRLFWKSSAYALYRGTNGWTFLIGSTSLNHNSNIPSTGTWYHIAATYDGSNQKLYINGVLVDTESKTGSIPTNNNSLYIGGIDSNRFFDGKIGAAKIYSKALTESELYADFNATKSTYGL